MELPAVFGSSRRRGEGSHRLGIRPGDRVMIASENSVALGAMLFAASKLEAWGIAVNPRLSAREIDLIGTHSGARRVLFNSALSKEAADHASRVGAEIGAVGPFGGIRYWSAQCGCASRARREGRRPSGRGPFVHLGHDRCSEGSHAEPPQPALYRKDFREFFAKAVRATASTACCRCPTSSGIRSC